MARPVGSKNKTPRELRAEAASLVKRAELMERIERLKNKTKKKND